MHCHEGAAALTAGIGNARQGFFNQRGGAGAPGSKRGGGFNHGFGHGAVSGVQKGCGGNHDRKRAQGQSPPGQNPFALTG
ncbi:MAG: hypothetical protein ACKOC9_16720, partial [Alphaproteobacteria bacterium]